MGLGVRDNPWENWWWWPVQGGGRLEPRSASAWTDIKSALLEGWQEWIFSLKKWVVGWEWNIEKTLRRRGDQREGWVGLKDGVLCLWTNTTCALSASRWWWRWWWWWWPGRVSTELLWAIHRKRARVGKKSEGCCCRKIWGIQGIQLMRLANVPAAQT